MIGKSFVERAVEVGPKNCSELVRQGLEHYLNTITGSLGPITKNDIPLVVAALDVFSQDLKSTNPGSDELSKSILQEIEIETIILEIGKEK